jgi:hypothetical protein
LIQTIVQLQKDFILSNNKQDLKYISHKQILAYHKQKFNIPLVSSNISTISHNTFYKDINNRKFRLDYLIPKRHYILYLKCRYLLNQDINLTDKSISDILKA